MNKSEKAKNPLWTKNFTIITLGSVISMMGSALAGFAMSLLVLDYTGSTFLFALYNFIYLLPSVVMPLISGPFLDRFSRRKTIYTLDFLASAVYVILALILHTGYFNFAFLATGCFILGTLDSMYTVAYQSFYPLLIAEGNYSKAYSTASVLETMCALMVPVSALIYNKVGVVPLFLCNAVTYLIAAIMETKIDADEKYIQIQKESLAEINRDTSSFKGTVAQLYRDFKEGLSYLVGEKGLFAIACYFAVSSFAGGGSETILLPFFNGAYDNGEYIYMLVTGMMSAGRFIGGTIHYKVQIPTYAKFTIAMVVYVTISALESFYLYTPIWCMMIIGLIIGMLGVTSYNIRVSATQKYVPDEKKGRFNSVFMVINTVGMLIGQLVAGALAEIISPRLVISIYMIICIFAALIFIGGNKKHVSTIYNNQA